MLKYIIIGAFTVLVSLFLTKSILTIQRLDVKAGLAKNSFDDVEEGISSLVKPYIRSIDVLASSRDFAGLVISRSRVGLETRIDDLISKIDGVELIIVSDKAGNIIASNTKNGRVKSFNNQQMLEKSIALSSWFSKSHKALPDFDNTWDLVSSKLPSVVFRDSNEKLLIEVVSTVSDVTDTKVGVVTAYFLADELQRFLDKKDLVLLSNSGFRIGASYSVPVDRVIIPKLEKRLKTNLIELISIKPSKLPINCGLIKRDSIDLLDLDLFEIKIMGLVIGLEVLFFLFLMRKKHIYQKVIEEKNTELGALKDFRDRINRAGINFEGNKLNYSKDLIDDVSIDYINRLRDKDNEIRELNTELQGLQEIKKQYTGLAERFNINLSVIKDFYADLQETVRITEKSVRKTRKEDSPPNDEISQPDFKNFEEIVGKRELVLTTLRDLEEESRSLLQNIYSAYLKDVPADLKIIFESIKRRLRFLNLNIGALDGLFTEADIRGMVNISREYVELKKENNKLRKESSRAHFIEHDLEHYKNSVDSILVSLKEMEDSVGKFINTDV